MLTYSRFVPAAAPDDALAVTEAHVRAHLSSVADPSDDPDTHAPDVAIEHRQQGDDGVLIVGHLDGLVAKAPYLADGYDPDAGDTGHTFERWAGPQ